MLVKAPTLTEFFVSTPIRSSDGRCAAGDVMPTTLRNLRISILSRSSSIALSLSRMEGRSVATPNAVALGVSPGDTRRLGGPAYRPSEPCRSPRWVPQFNTLIGVPLNRAACGAGQRSAAMGRPASTTAPRGSTQTLRLRRRQCLDGGDDPQPYVRVDRPGVPAVLSQSHGLSWAGDRAGSFNTTTAPPEHVPVGGRRDGDRSRR